MVKHALRELVTEHTPADDILNITVCEPAMGSAAFLNEAVNQLAQLYFGAGYAEHARKIARRITNQLGMLDFEKLFDVPVAKQKRTFGANVRSYQ